MIIKRIKLKLLIISLLPFGLLLSYLSSYFPSVVENYYSRGINKPIRQGLSLFFGIFPFSCGELIVIIATIFSVYIIISFIKGFIKSSYKKTVFLNFLLNLLMTVSVVYFSFMLLWGLNYGRYPFSKIAKLNMQPASVKDLKELCSSLINEANTLKTEIASTRKIKNMNNESTEDIFSEVSVAYNASSRDYSVLSGNYGRPKGIFNSKALSYAGLSGIYFPFTGEPNVNVDIPNSMLASTACHEAAHQRGFAREDEANYISYLVCLSSSDPSFKYSGKLLALIYSMNALYSHDVVLYRELATKYSYGVKQDLREIDSYWEKYEGPIEKLSTNINNAYLKANRQENGVYSYGRMVDLLLARYKSQKSHNSTNITP